MSSSANDGGDDYHNLSFESDKWPSDYWERDYNKNFLYNNTRVHRKFAPITFMYMCMDYLKLFETDIEAECQDDYMKIRIGFNATFNGLIYSAGYAYDPDCMYINGSGRDYYEFFIQLNRCGTLGKNALHEEKRKNPTVITLKKYILFILKFGFVTELYVEYCDSTIQSTHRRRI